MLQKQCKYSCGRKAMIGVVIHLVSVVVPFAFVFPAIEPVEVVMRDLFFMITIAVTTII